MQVTEEMSSLVIAQLLYLESEAANKPIYLYINSPGGLVTAGMGIYDTMQVRATPLLPLLCCCCCCCERILCRV